MATLAAIISIVIISLVLAVRVIIMPKKSVRCQLREDK